MKKLSKEKFEILKEQTSRLLEEGFKIKKVNNNSINIQNMFIYYGNENNFNGIILMPNHIIITEDEEQTKEILNILTK